MVDFGQWFFNHRTSTHEILHQRRAKSRVLPYDYEQQELWCNVQTIERLERGDESSSPTVLRNLVLVSEDGRIFSGTPESTLSFLSSSELRHRHLLTMQKNNCSKSEQRRFIKQCDKRAGVVCAEYSALSKTRRFTTVATIALLAVAVALVVLTGAPFKFFLLAASVILLACSAVMRLAMKVCVPWTRRIQLATRGDGEDEGYVAIDHKTRTVMSTAIYDVTPFQYRVEPYVTMKSLAEPESQEDAARLLSDVAELTDVKNVNLAEMADDAVRTLGLDDDFLKLTVETEMMSEREKMEQQLSDSITTRIMELSILHEQKLNDRRVSSAK